MQVWFTNRIPDWRYNDDPITKEKILDWANKWSTFEVPDENPNPVPKFVVAENKTSSDIRVEFGGKYIHTYTYIRTLTEVAPISYSRFFHGRKPSVFWQFVSTLFLKNLTTWKLTLGTPLVVTCTYNHGLKVAMELWDEIFHKCGILISVPMSCNLSIVWTNYI